LAKLNDAGRALEFLSLALDEGYRCYYTLVHDPWLDSLRPLKQFADMVNEYRYEPSFSTTEAIGYWEFM
jgi:hypothetical protein